MNTYHVTWEADIDASSPIEAAREVRKWHLDPNSMAVVFDITGEDGKTERVDLLDENEDL